VRLRLPSTEALALDEVRHDLGLERRDTVGQALEHSVDEPVRLLVRDPDALADRTEAQPALPQPHAVVRSQAG
jgi:hypothetical protein